MGLVVGSEWRAALWRSCRAAQSPMRARGMSTCLGPYRGFWVLDSGAFHRQVCGQTGVTGRKADVQLAAWTARQAGRKRLPSGLLPRVWQPRRSPAAPLGRAQHPSVHSASTPPPPRLHPHQVRHCMLLHHDKLVWSGLTHGSTRLLHRYLLQVLTTYRAATT